MKFKVFHYESLGEDYKEYEAFDAEHASQIYAEEYDDYDEPTIAMADGLDGIHVTVEDEKGKQSKFWVTGYFSREYSAEEVE